jgi:hypothetical protein
MSFAEQVGTKSHLDAGAQRRLDRARPGVKHLLKLAKAPLRVRPISREAAARVITLFEPMPAIVTHCFGLFFGDTLAGAVVYGPEYGHNLRPATGNIGLLRGASLPQAPRNSGSRLIHPRRHRKTWQSSASVTSAHRW